MVMIDDLHTSHVTESNSRPHPHPPNLQTRVDNQGGGGPLQWRIQDLPAGAIPEEVPTYYL